MKFHFHFGPGKNDLAPVVGSVHISVIPPWGTGAEQNNTGGQKDSGEQGNQR